MDRGKKEWETERKGKFKSCNMSALDLGDQKASTVGKALALHVADPGSIPSTIYSFQAPAGMISEHSARAKPSELLSYSNKNSVHVILRLKYDKNQQHILYLIFSLE